MSVSLELPKLLELGSKGTAIALISSPKIALTRLEACLETSGPLSDTPCPIVNGTLKDGSARLELPLLLPRRGRLVVTWLWLRWKGPFGLCRLTKKVPFSLAWDCVVKVSGLHEAALTFFLREAEPGQKSQPFRGEGTEFDSLAEYSQGMDNRLIDWKRSAHHRRLLAKEFRQERNHQVILGFDTGRLMLEPVGGLTKLDHFVRAGLLMAWVCLLSGDVVGASDFSLRFNAFLKPGRGRGFFARVQRFASGLTYRYEETNFAAGLSELHSRLPHRSLVVIFTEFIDAISAEFLIESLALLAKKHAVLFVTLPDPTLAEIRDRRPSRIGELAGSVIADDFVRDRGIVIERMARLGAHVVDVPPKALSAAILNRYLAIKQRGLI
jgi:uncharacterized protein (DUF58 family)